MTVVSRMPPIIRTAASARCAGFRGIQLFGRHFVQPFAVALLRFGTPSRSGKR